MNTAFLYSSVTVTVIYTNKLCIASMGEFILMANVFLWISITSGEKKVSKQSFSKSLFIETGLKTIKHDILVSNTIAPNQVRKHLSQNRCKNVGNEELMMNKKTHSSKKNKKIRDVISTITCTFLLAFLW